MQREFLFVAGEIRLAEDLAFHSKDLVYDEREPASCGDQGTPQKG